MKPIYLLTLFLAFTLSTKAKSNFRVTVLSADTIKKGINYIHHSQSENIAKVTFNKAKKGKVNSVHIKLGYPTQNSGSNTVNSSILQSNKQYTLDNTPPVFDKIDILSGNYGDIQVSKATKTKNLFELSDVKFPLRLKLHSGKEFIDLELTEAGEWNIEIDLKNN